MRHREKSLQLLYMVMEHKYGVSSHKQLHGYRLEILGGCLLEV